MEKAKKDVGQKFRRIKHNLINLTKKDGDVDLEIINALEHRNQKVINAVSLYRKHVSNAVKAELREENVDKRRALQAAYIAQAKRSSKLGDWIRKESWSTLRKDAICGEVELEIKKLDEFSLCVDLHEISTDLEQSHTTTCLHKVIQKISQALQLVVDEKIKHDLMIEKRVDDLVQFQDMEEAICRSRERLSNAFIDVGIAKKHLEKAQSTSSNMDQLQDNFDVAQFKLENQKDNTIKDVYSLAAKEQEIAKVFTALLEEQLEYHRDAMRTLATVLPEIHRDINNARPRPVFGIDLSEHLRHTQGRVALVLEKCCSMLRASGFTEPGLFRVEGNNTKVRRMKAAFNAGQIDVDEHAYCMDPHSVCCVLKSYLRELPNPLLTHRLHNDWMNAAKLKDEAKLQAFERCLGELPACHLHNLAYLINFLSEMLQHQEQTRMNCGNLAIVFGPILLGGNINGNNAESVKIVGTLLKNASRLFGCSVVSNNGNNSGQHPPGRLTVGTNSLKPGQSKDRLEFSSISSCGTSPRGRPKERARPPPYVTSQTAGSLIDLSDGCNNAEQSAHTSTSSRIESSLTQSQILTPADLSESFGMSPTATAESDDSFDEWEDESSSGSMSRSQGDVAVASLTTPQRPPPPVLSNFSCTVKCDIIQLSGTGQKAPIIGRYFIIKLLGWRRCQFHALVSKQVVAVEALPLPARNNKPLLPVKPRNGGNETSRL